MTAITRESGKYTELLRRAKRAEQIMSQLEELETFDCSKVTCKDWNTNRELISTSLLMSIVHAGKEHLVNQLQVELASLLN